MTLVFVVTNLTAVFATDYEFGNEDETPEENTEVSDSNAIGGQNNPYSVTLSGRNSRVVVKAESMPFYFTVSTTGAYQVDYDSATSNITFALLQTIDDYNNYIAILTKEEQADLDNYQLGVTSTTSEYIPVTVTTYEIKENTDMYKNGVRTTTLKSVTDNISDLPTGSIFVFNSALGQKDEAFYDAMLLPMGYVKFAGNAKWYNYEYGNMEIKSSTTRTTLVLPSPSNEAPYGIKTVYSFEGMSGAIDESKDDVSSLEELISRIFMSIGDVLFIDIFQALFGRNLSIDSLVFNRYQPTTIDLYSSRGGGIINETLREVINTWFEIFSYLVYICFVIILVYIGIIAIASAGTEKQSKIRGYFTSWLSGLLILLFVPTFATKYILKINDALVQYMGVNASKVQTYYNIYIYSAESEEIQGSDSATVSVEELYKMKEETESAIGKSNTEYAKRKNALQEEIIDDVVANLRESALENSMTFSEWIGTRFASDVEIASNVLLPEDIAFIEKMVDSASYSAVKLLDQNWDEERIRREVTLWQRQTLNGEKQLGKIDPNVISAVDKVMFSNGSMTNKYWDTTMELARLQKRLGTIDEAIEIAENDIMGMMRVRAGQYRRLIYVIVWYILLFQLISLTMLYFKRIFVIGILIVVFPWIALFYAIDKMADGSSQTLKMWFKEFLANVFVQSIHAVIYVTIIEMSLQIYRADNTNWIWFLASVLMLIPAEGMLKSIMGVEGSTLRKLGGSFMNAVGVAAALHTMSKLRTDRYDKDRARVKSMQKSQEKADQKALIRKNNRIMKTGNPNAEATGLEKLREGAYKVGSEARSFVAEHGTDISRAASVAKTAAAGTVALGYMATEGFSSDSIITATAVGTSLAGYNAKKTDKKDIKGELQGAYQREKIEKERAKIENSEE